MVSDPGRVVHTFDIVDRPARESYWRQIPTPARERINAYLTPGQQPPEEVTDVELLYIDGAHRFEPTVEIFNAWRPRITKNAAVAIHDYANPRFPGVAQAIHHLGLDGEAVGNLFVWRPT